MHWGGGKLTHIYAANPAVSGAAPPTSSKELVSNEDGTYTLSLSVTGTADSSTITRKADVVVVFDTSGSMNFDQQGAEPSSWWFSPPSRLAVAKGAVNALAQQLLANNTPENPDQVRLSLVTFANLASTQIVGTQSLDAFRDVVTDLTAEGGTNWEDALKKANLIAPREGAEVYVIFVSDGDPTFRITQGDISGWWGSGEDQQHGSYPNYYYGSGQSDNNGKNYKYALEQAKNIVNAGKNLYSIGVFGNIANMQSLATESGAPSSNYYYAQDQGALNAAFSNIINKITNTLGYKDIVFSDGITSMTSSPVKSDPTGFTYERSGGAYGAGTVWENAPRARYADGQVTWSLGNMQLEKGVTYTVRFKVWPSQESQDLVSDLNNGMKQYDDLTSEQKAQIVRLNGEGYGLKTNTDVNLSYTQIETKIVNRKPEGFAEGMPAADGYIYTYDADTGNYIGIKETLGSTSLLNPDPVSVRNSKLTIRKGWKDVLGTEYRPQEVNLNIKRDDETYIPVTLTAAESWAKSIYVSPGLKVGDHVLEVGHDYTVEEVDLTNHYELYADVFHPMIVDGVLNKNETGGAIVTIVNERTSNLNITKEVLHDEGTTPNPDQLFEYAIQVTDRNGADVQFSIGDQSGPVDVSSEHRVDGATVQSQGTYYSATSSVPFVVKMKDGENIRFTDLPRESTYEIEEVRIPAVYECSVETTDDVLIYGNKVTGTIATGDTQYNVAYKNTYRVAPTTAKIPVTKLLEKAEGVAGPEDITGKYTFTLSAQDGAPMPEEAVKVNPDADGGEMNFGEITYTKPGIYIYTVTETGTVSGVTNDAIAEKKVIVSVSDNGDGTLKAKVRGADSIDEVVETTTFINRYDVKPTEARITAQKVLKNAKLAAGAFSFELVAKEGTPMPKSTNATNMADGSITFGSIAYAKPGEYTYTIKEQVGTAEYIDYDRSEKTVTVRVADNGDGTLNATVEGDGEAATFINTYKASGELALISAVKKVNGSAASQNIFEFTITADDGVPLPDVTTVINQGGSISFGPIYYDQSIFADSNESSTTVETTPEASEGESVSPEVDTGTEEESVSPEVEEAAKGNSTELDVREVAKKESSASASERGSGENDIEPGKRDESRSKTFIYTITEVSGNASGYSYDDHSETVKVTVTDNGDGTLHTDVTYDEDSAVFHNAYEARGTAVITAHKVLKGRDLADHRFTFALYEGDQRIATAENDANGEILFMVSYDETMTGEHIYQIRELVAKPMDGYLYDGSAKNVRVNVTDQGDGTLTAAVTADEEMTFTNGYVPLPTSVLLTAQKELKGRKLGEGEFSFIVTDPKGTVVSHGQNDASGKIEFSAIPVGEVGVYEFIASEINDKAEGIQYDATEFVYQVKVEDRNGRLVVTKITVKDAPNGAVFQNEYEEILLPAPPIIKKTVAPKTGDREMALISAIALFISGAGAVLIGKRKRL